MRKLGKGLLLVLLGLVIACGVAYFVLKNIKVPMVNIIDVDLEQVQDGSYRGEYSAGPVLVTTRIVVNDNIIKEIVIEKHQCGLGKKAEKIIDDVIKQQTLAVDIISGATLSSQVILKAIESGLNQGFKNN
jgi:uncharacterized protein with FMN-binding domain